MEKTKVAIVGMGTVGTGVAKLLLDHGDRTARHAGRTLWLEQVVVRDLTKPRQADLPSGVLTDELQRVTEDRSIEVVAQLIGGLHPAYEIMMQLLESGKDVVTANKALLAEHGPALFDRARELGRSIAFEASVAGGIPIIANISQCLSANQILSIHSILNGTSNFILTRMESGESYEAAVAEAQRRGLAEQNPAMDVDGTDAAQKLAIIAHLAFGARIHWSDIPRTGIDTITPADIRFADELGYRIRLLSVAALRDHGLEVHVGPTLVRKGRPLAEVRGENNAISVDGDAVGRVFFHGLGAGQMPTASAVVADMIDTAVGRTRLTFQTLELWSNQTARVTQATPELTEHRFYLRFSIDDRPGVLAQIAGILGEHGISIASVIQHGNDPEGPPSAIPLVVMTHAAPEASLAKSLRTIDELAAVFPGTQSYRVLD